MDIPEFKKGDGRWKIRENSDHSKRNQNRHREYGDSAELFQKPSDSRKNSADHPLDPNWEKIKLNGVIFPYFPKYPKKRSTRESQPPAQPQTQNVLNSQRNNCDNSEQLKLLECPICIDTIVQATALRCGHLFCYNCILIWRSKKNWCPICQDRITDLSRIYAVDELVVSNWTHLSPHIHDLLRSAETTRLAKLESEKNDFLPKFYRELQIYRIYLQSKGFWHGLTYPLIRWWRNIDHGNTHFDIPTMIKALVLIMIGCLLCGPCSLANLLHSVLDFFGYLVHCILMYPGWMQQCNDPWNESTDQADRLIF